MANAELRAHRTRGSVTLVAVSKLQPVSAIEAAYAAGQRDFGESYAQELEAKAKALAHLGDLRWHFIGNLQRNKVKLVAPWAQVLHTLDSGALAQELDKRLLSVDRVLDVLVEVNVGGEAQKHGIDPAHLTELLDAAAGCGRLRARGLMTMPPGGDPSAAERCFRSLAVLGARHAASLGDVPLLSMGMSDDLELAVACGSTHVRVGTAIFGPRDPGAKRSEPTRAPPDDPR